MKIYAETPRLILRELCPDDAPGMFELDSSPEVHRYLGNRPIQTLEEAKKVIESIRGQYVSKGIGRWAVIEKESNQFAGWSGLKLVEDDFNGFKDFYDVGYRFIPKFWGKGFATESGKAALQYGFDVLNLEMIYGMVDQENQASIRALEKLGLKRAGEFRHQLHGSEERPLFWYELDVQNFRS